MDSATSMTFADWGKLALQTGVPTALVAFVIFWTFTRMVPKLMADFRETLAAQHTESLAGSKQARDDFLGALKERGDVFWVQFHNHAQSCERQIERDRQAHQHQIELLADSIRELSNVIVFQTREIVDTKEGVENIPRRMEQHRQGREQKP